MDNPTQPTAQPQISLTQLKPFLLTAAIIAIISAVAATISIFLFPKTPSSTYKLRCGQTTLQNCNKEQLKQNDRISLRLDVSSALSKYQNTKPDLCYYTNVAQTEKLLPAQKINLNEDDTLYGGCIKDAYSVDTKKSQFAIFINGRLLQPKFIAKVFLTKSGNQTTEEKIKNGTEIFSIE